MRNIFFFIVLLGVWACTSETELKRSIFLPDPEMPALPRYSEWGYNTFGAFYDRQPFISNDRSVPVKVINNGGETSFVFTGMLNNNNGYYYYNGGNEFTMTLSLTGFDPETYADLVALHGTTLDLTSADCKVELQHAGDTSQVQVLEGTFEFRRAQRLLVDEAPEEVILSGVFEFRALIDGNPVSVSDGRYDVGIGSFNFFKY